ncbi:MAG: hypothetical protein AAF939_10760 [Planctomycetota bacterium]
MSVFVRSCTTSHSNAHVTESRVLYRWHPWYQLEVSVEGSMTRKGVPTFRCRLLSALDGKAFDIPQWMFDSSVCASMQFQDHPRVSLVALKSLATLILELKSVGCSTTVVEGTHFQNEDGDVSHAVTTSTKKLPVSNAAVHPSPDGSPVERSAASSKRTSST